ncbi:DEAD/DEAH box helicase family protein [Glycomyces paridis]|uniref:Restriction endonuclease n=1 Tax=Glycomyces paridis TaxID=2126555 RepID=A0A4S8P361_9ACTN|nr:DEAD/DEAH box helicase family protein [Glycomyces paridis]THV24480.1 restriction endonuclease [Glycomyces paridis]
MDAKLADLARRSPNFGRLFPLSELLALYGAQAEATVYEHPNVSLTQSGKFGDTLAEILVMRFGLRVPGGHQIDRIRELARFGALLPEIERDFHFLRVERNEVVHEHVFEVKRALQAVQVCHKLGLWYHDAIQNKRTAEAFVPPSPHSPFVREPSSASDEVAEMILSFRDTLTEAETRLGESADRIEAERLARERAENRMASAVQVQDEMRRQLEALSEQVARLSTQHEHAYAQAKANPAKPDVRARDNIVHRLRRERPRNEVESRREIDKFLKAAGWVLQDFADLNPDAGTGVAVREFPLANGRADYVLYVNGSIVGVIEAKREGESLTAAVAQNDRYARGVHRDYSLAAWNRDEPFTFRYATTGAETLFVNHLDPDPRSREVFAFHKPETVARWMREAGEHPEAPTFRAALRALPGLDEGGFRPAQIDAIHGLERSLAADKPKALIQMATGAGKTYMGAAETYRLLKFARARRVLFLVDRNNLGRQAEFEFNHYIAPDDGRRLEDLYGIDRLGPAGLQETSSVVICTIQRMYALLRGEHLEDSLDADEREDAYERDKPVEIGYNPAVPIESFDLIIVDECHRSIYGLWRGVLEYFDAHLVGLTATPTMQTLGFFSKNLVSEYTYPQSVADGVNVDFDILKLRTSLRRDGQATIDAGETVEVRDRATRHRRYEQLEDDYTYTTNQVGRKAESVDEIRQVLTYYRDHWREWFPGRAEVPKTLIFAVSDPHADSVIAQAKEVFERGDDFAKKITYKTRQAGEDPNQLIRDFRTSPTLRIACTVDMIATGTDIRALECVIFMRTTASAVQFEQMKGRGARTINPVELQEVTPGADDTVRKSKFLLIDAVGVTDHPLNDAKPLVPAGPKQVSLKKLLERTATKSIDLDQAEMLAGRLARLEQQLTDDERRLLEHTSGGWSLNRIASGIVAATDADAQERAKEAVRFEGGDEKAAERAARELIVKAIEPLTTNPKLRREIIDIRRDKDYVVDDLTDVEVLGIETLTAEERSQEIVASWHQFLEDNRDQITAIEIAMNHPGRMTPSEVYAELEALAAMIGRPQRAWTPEHLWLCYERLGKAAEHPGRGAGIPDLITLIRYELGEDTELKPYQEVVRERFAGWLLRQEQAKVTFTEDQMWWLERICEVVASDIGIEAKLMNEEPFRERGGGRGFKKAMRQAYPDREPLDLLTELNRELA